ncbi:hypothetical protein mO072L [Vaccinia virus]|uniref:Uncharacterized protein n=2 Tax=Vaccinia virus TaxID=10245 RepID=Q49PS6_VACC0|nr:hypothetical protein m8072L [Vaccinia virus]AAW23747.1 hypothetical protein mO072L [Vaccinia virus]ABZ79978.1 unknown [synthetic Vaccinia virus]BBD06123.1 putative E ORF B [BAC cloning vector pLC16m8.8S-BAC]
MFNFSVSNPINPFSTSSSYLYALYSPLLNKSLNSIFNTFSTNSWDVTHCSTICLIKRVSSSDSPLILYMGFRLYLASIVYLSDSAINILSTCVPIILHLLDLHSLL